jgi:tryptophanyl-tRNA synthetase
LYQGKGFGDFKKGLAEVVIQGIEPLQKRIKELYSDKEALQKILLEGSERARAIAYPKMAEIKKRLGLGR